METLRNERGFVLVLALVILAALSLIGIAAMNTTLLEKTIANNDKVHKRTLYQAEAAALLSTEVLEQNINCLLGFTQTGTADETPVADLENSIRVWSRGPNPPDDMRNELAMYFDPLPWTGTVCTPTFPDEPNISYPIANVNSGVELSDVYLGGHIAPLKGGSLVMHAGYERKGRSAAGGGTARMYDIIAVHNGLNNSQSMVVVGWRHLVGEESECKY